MHNRLIPNVSVEFSDVYIIIIIVFLLFLHITSVMDYQEKGRAVT